MNKCILASVVLCLLSAAAAAQDEAAEAQKILRAAGVQGGLVVDLGCGDGKLTAALHADNGYLVQGLDDKAANVEAARKYIRSLGLYGCVSAESFDGKHLPYVDNLVNLLVARRLGGVTMDEVMRVLAPLGVAYVQQGGRWVKTVKPWPSDIDEWTHFLHGPDNNAVAQDRVVGPPTGLQWVANPIHLRAHEYLNSISCVVSSRGRIFYIIDEGPTSDIAAPPRWRLVARDAFSGVLLWKRDIGPWEGTFRLFRSGPPDIARRLVAVDDRVYATLGFGKPVAAFDAATGKTLEVYDATKGATEILCTGKRLFVVVGSIDLTPPADPALRFYPHPAARHKGIVALDAASGKTLWTRRDEVTSELMPTTMAVSGGRLFFQNPECVVCLDAADGSQQWTAERPVYTKRLSWSAPTLVATDGVVLSADGASADRTAAAPTGKGPVQWVMSDRDIRHHPPGDVVAFSAKDGKRLWTGRSLQGFCNPGDLFVVNDRVWCGADVSSGEPLLDAAVDLKTGKVLSTRPKKSWPVAGHTRCYRNKATEKYLVLGDVGVTFVSTKDWSYNANSWVRGTCQYGIMPCNGLLYAPPDSCACRPEMRLHGFTAMAPHRSDEDSPTPTNPLERGPAFAWAHATPGVASAAPAGQWPTYRHDAARSGLTETHVPADVSVAWKAKIAGRLTSPTVASGKVFVCRIDTDTVYALDAKSGAVAWSRTVGGTVDSPPTVLGKLVLFGCRDGCVYCLRAEDGQTVWRFRAAPRNQQIVAMDRVESPWPVHGSVLVRDGQVWFVAGRSPYLDGGIRLFAIDPVSGKIIVKRTIFSRGTGAHDAAAPQQGTVITKPNLPDILSASGSEVYMRWMAFDDHGDLANVQPHLFSATGFLDDTWWHRTYWQYGTWMRGGFGGWPTAAQHVPAGRIMVVDDNTLISFARSRYDAGNGGNAFAGHVGLVKQDYQDSGRLDPAKNPYVLYAVEKLKPAPARRRSSRKPPKWSKSIPLLVRAMLVADGTLFIAGPAADANHKALMDLGNPQPGLLWALSAADGKVLARHPLAVGPVQDGLIAANDSLYMATTDGRVMCLRGAK